MNWFKETLFINTEGKGLYNITEQVQQCIKKWGVKEGMCFLYIPHCSASLVINEDYDPLVKQDLETFLNKLTPENQPWYVHNDEGPDDSPSHMRVLLMPVSIDIPIDDHKLTLGTWQGILLAEHRRGPKRREVLLRVLSI